MGSIRLYPFGSELSGDQCARFEKSTVKRKYSAGETVHQPMSRCEGMVYVVEGSLRIYILSDDGREISLYRLKKGELCVLSASCVIEAISSSSEFTFLSFIILFIMIVPIPPTITIFFICCIPFCGSKAAADMFFDLMYIVAACQGLFRDKVTLCEKRALR